MSEIKPPLGITIVGVFDSGVVACGESESLEKDVAKMTPLAGEIIGWYPVPNVEKFLLNTDEELN